ncbi:hypothetical protein EUGRSUZ_K00244 [Eucalyptus grandis]|uniref:Uncharacterized protein n=2 Tax=Eucalyptus grandis TaxID=71139 RepID=A0ACC3IRU7_EUCGR|nr:hypothetical protein EUGRSUZ_K00244 [Eucalyptus grandis]
MNRNGNLMSSKHKLTSKETETNPPFPLYSPRFTPSKHQELIQLTKTETSKAIDLSSLFLFLPQSPKHYMQPSNLHDHERHRHTSLAAPTAA